jgi:hypothetical protein
MDLIIKLPHQDISGVNIKCTSESTFTPEVNAAILKILHLIIADAGTRNEEEQLFLNDWASTRTTVSPKAADPAGAVPPPAAVVPATAAPEKGAKKDYLTQIRDGMRVIRGLVKERNERCTVYKIIFHAAVVSARATVQLDAAFVVIREQLDMDAIVYSLISDGTIQAMKNSPCKVSELGDSAKMAILAMSLIALNADDQKHVLEISAVKLSMMTLGIASIDNLKVAEYAKKGAKAIIDELPENARPVALLNAVRLVVADNQTLECEKHLVRGIAASIPGPIVRMVVKIVALECNKKFEV